MTKQSERFGWTKILEFLIKICFNGPNSDLPNIITIKTVYISRKISLSDLNSTIENLVIVESTNNNQNHRNNKSFCVDKIGPIKICVFLFIFFFRQCWSEKWLFFSCCICVGSITVTTTSLYALAQYNSPQLYTLFSNECRFN